MDAAGRLGEERVIGRLTKRAFRRACLRLIQRRRSPKEARKQRIGRRKVRVCDLEDGHLLNTVFLYRRLAADDPMSFFNYGTVLGILEREASRRRLPCKVKPKWLIERNRKWLVSSTS